MMIEHFTGRNPRKMTRRLQLAYLQRIWRLQLAIKGEGYSDADIVKANTLADP